MSKNIKVTTSENTKIDKNGEEHTVLETVFTKIKDEEDIPRPDEVGSALLQARQLFNDCEDITDEIKKLGYDTGKSYVVNEKYRIIKVHYYSWGLFWTTLLKAFKNQLNLKKWSPNLFKNDVTCCQCAGEGKIAIPSGTKEYDEAFADWECPTSDYGIPIFKFCSPCQGVGFTYVKPIEDKEEIV